VGKKTEWIFGGAVSPDKHTFIRRVITRHRTSDSRAFEERMTHGCLDATTIENCKLKLYLNYVNYFNYNLTVF